MELYVAAILDCFDGSIVGLKMVDHMRAQLCVDAFSWAAKKYQGFGMIFHSDRGSQYTSSIYRQVLAAYGAVQSMSNTGKCSGFQVPWERQGTSGRQRYVITDEIMHSIPYTKLKAYAML